MVPSPTDKSAISARKPSLSDANRAETASIAA